MVLAWIIHEHSGRGTEGHGFNRAVTCGSQNSVRSAPRADCSENPLAARKGEVEWEPAFGGVKTPPFRKRPFLHE
jgi:hypothetical protein